MQNAKCKIIEDFRFGENLHSFSTFNFQFKNAVANLGAGARVALRASDMCLRHVIFASRVILPSAVIFAFGELFMR